MYRAVINRIVVSNRSRPLASRRSLLFILQVTMTSFQSIASPSE